MKSTVLKFDPRVIKGPSDLAGESRSGGLHLSEIYWDLEISWQKRMREEMSEEERQFYFAGGFLWEVVFSQAMAESMRGGDIVRPGEWNVQGITGSPDNLRLVPDYRVLETKATWKSVNKWDTGPVEKWFWIWIVQVKGYCKMVGTREAELYAMFMNGDYRGSGPQCRGVLWEFSPLEIDENWEMIKSHAKRRGWISE